MTIQTKTAKCFPIGLYEMRHQRLQLRTCGFHCLIFPLSYFFCPYFSSSCSYSWWCVVMALCLPLPPPHCLPESLMHFLIYLFCVCGGGGWSAAGWDDSRACFSLWIYYLCSGPFKSTQSGPGASCGEFILTHRLLLPTQQPQLNPSKPAASTCLTPLMRCLWRFDLKVWRFCTCWPACSLLSFSSHILALLHNSMAFHP